MSRFSSPLDNVHVAAPCSADWDQMIGNDRSRFCGQCNLNVYNLSSMTQAEAEHFVAGSEGRLCVRFYRRRDGSILTQNCPVGLRAIRRRVSAITRAITSAVLAFFAGVGAYEAFSAVSSDQRRWGSTTGEIAARPSQLPVLPPSTVIKPPPIATVGRIAVRRPESNFSSANANRKKDHTDDQ